MQETEKNSYRVPVHTSKYTTLTVSLWASHKIPINLTQKWEMLFIHCQGLLTTWIQGHCGNPNEPQMCWGSWDRWRFWDPRAIFQQELIPVNGEVLLFQRLGAPTSKRLGNLQVIQDQYYISTRKHGMFCWKHCRGVCLEIYSFPSPCCWPV